jgi:PAS domain S-box-containing protein
MNPECKHSSSCDSKPPDLPCGKAPFREVPQAPATAHPLRRRTLAGPAKTSAGPRDDEFLPLVAARLARVGSWILDMRTTQISWSHEFLEICDFQRTPPPTLKRVLSLVSSPSQEAARLAFERLLDGQDIVHVDLHVTTEIGRALWLRVTAEPARWNGGTLTRIRGAIQDITEFKAFESAVERAKAQLTLYQDLASDAMITVGRDGEFLFLNSAAGRLLCRSRTDLIGKLAYEEYPRLAGSKYHAHFLRVVLEQRTTGFETYATELRKRLRITMCSTPPGVTAFVRVVVTTQDQ